MHGNEDHIVNRGSPFKKIAMKNQLNDQALVPTSSKNYKMHKRKVQPSPKAKPLILK